MSMEEKRLWEILGTWEDTEVSPNFKLNFWRRAERAEQRRRLIIKRLVPSLSLLTILIVGTFFYLSKPSPYFELPSISQNLEGLSSEELLAETINYSGLETIMTETFSSEEILTVLIPKEILEEGGTPCDE